MLSSLLAVFCVLLTKWCTHKSINLYLHLNGFGICTLMFVFPCMDKLRVIVKMYANHRWYICINLFCPYFCSLWEFISEIIFFSLIFFCLFHFHIFTNILLTNVSKAEITRSTNKIKRKHLHGNTDVRLLTCILVRGRLKFTTRCNVGIQYMKL